MDFVEVLKYYYDNEELSNTGVALTNEYTLNHFNLLFSPQRRLGFTRDRLLTFSNVFYFHKPSLLKDFFNEELYKYREAGLIRYWIKQHMDTRNEKSYQREPITLKVENILGVFQICALMYFISFMIFILEVISGRCPRVKCILDYLTY